MCEYSVRTVNETVSVPKHSLVQVECRVQTSPFREDQALIFEPNKKPQWPEGLEVCDSLTTVKAGMAPKIIVGVQNSTNHDIILAGRTTIGTAQSARSVYPANIFKTDHPLTASTHHVQAHSSSRNTSSLKKCGPTIDLAHLDEHQRQIVNQLLREESESFSQSDDDIGCVTSLQMNISLKDAEPVSRTYLCPKTIIQRGERLLIGLDSTGMG